MGDDQVEASGLGFPQGRTKETDVYRTRCEGAAGRRVEERVSARRQGMGAVFKSRTWGRSGTYGIFPFMVTVPASK